MPTSLKLMLFGWINNYQDNWKYPHNLSLMRLTMFNEIYYGHKLSKISHQTQK